MYQSADYICCISQMLLSDFTHHHIEMACTLLETCGRFLFRSPDSHLRTSVLLVRNAQRRLITKNGSWISNSGEVKLRF